MYSLLCQSEWQSRLCCMKKDLLPEVEKRDLCVAKIVIGGLMCVSRRANASRGIVFYRKHKMNRKSAYYHNIALIKTSNVSNEKYLNQDCTKLSMNSCIFNVFVATT